MKLTVKLTLTFKHLIRNAHYMSALHLVVYLTFYQQLALFFGDELLYNFFSLHIR